MSQSNEGGDVYVTDRRPKGSVGSDVSLHIEAGIVRDVAEEQDVNESALRDALVQVQSRRQAVSLETISEVADAEIVGSDETGALYVVANAEACWLVEAESIGLSSTGRDAVIEAHRRQISSVVGDVTSHTFGFVLHCPDFPTDSVHRIRALREQTNLGNREAQVVALRDEGLAKAEVGTVLGLSEGGVASIIERVDREVERARNTVALVDLPGVLRLSALDPQSREWLGLEWGSWHSLNRADGEINDLPTRSGFYRVRHPEFEELIYIGESGAERGLRGRIRSGLAVGIYDEEMPSRSRTSHDGARRLWAIQREYGPGFEVSVAMPPIAADTQHRRGIEASLLAVHRREHGKSPIANFGRVIPGYRVDTENPRGHPGGPIDTAKRSVEERSLEPPPWDHWRDVQSVRWLGLDWTEPRPLRARTSIDDVEGCAYRVWGARGTKLRESSRLTYIGVTTTPMSRLYTLEEEYGSETRISITDIDDVEEEDGPRRRRLELTTDLVGAHYLATGEPPTDQF